MAITITTDDYHKPTVQTTAEPFDDVEKERLANFDTWRLEEERNQKRDHYFAKALISESKELSFAFDESIMPTRYRLTRGDHKWDYAGHVGIGGSHAVSQRFKEAIESVEPGVHQFIPFDLHQNSGELIEKPFYFWRIRTSLDAISPELGGVKPLGSSIDHLWAVEPGDGREKLAVHAEVVRGRAAWCDVRMVSRRFLSDEAVIQLKEHGVVGWTSDYFWKEI